MSESPVELARVRDDSCCRVEDTLQLVGRLPHSASQETATLIDSARDEVKARSLSSPPAQAVQSGIQKAEPSHLNA